MLWEKQNCISRMRRFHYIFIVYDLDFHYYLCKLTKHTLNSLVFFHLFLSPWLVNQMLMHSIAHPAINVYNKGPNHFILLCNMFFFFLKEIFAISREENLAVSVGLRDGRTRTGVQTTEHVCPVTQTQLMSCQREQASNDTAAQEFTAVRFRQN